MNTTAPAATIAVTVRFQSTRGPVADVELGVHERAEARRVSRYLAASRGGHFEGATGREDTTTAAVLVVVIPPGHADTDPHAVERMQRIAAIRATLLATEPGTEDYHRLTRELWYVEPAAQRPPPRGATPEQHVAATDGGPS